MLGARRVKRLYRRLSRELRIAVNKYPPRVRCNVCGWQGRRMFSDSWHPYTICPRCKSQLRHRLLFAAINTIPHLATGNLIQDKRILHFAPERILSRFLMGRAAKYVTADLYRDDVEMQIDICNISNFADATFDLVIACDVLEHVPDDSAALREIHRVLTLHGWVILTVPQKDNLATTYEDNTITTPEGREQAFGQNDHLRIYGDDFGRILENHGFTVTIVDQQYFDSAMIQKHVLFPPILSSHPLATNHRKIFFGQKKNS